MKWTYDDGGRASANHKGNARDCVVRACAIAMQRHYQDVYDELSVVQSQAMKRRQHAYESAGVSADRYRSPRNGVFDTSRYSRDWIEAQGWRWTPTMRIGSGCTVHLRPEELPAGRLIVKCSRHMVAVIDGVICDTHDPSREGTRCVYGYWSRGA